MENYETLKAEYDQALAAAKLIKTRLDELTRTIPDMSDKERELATQERFYLQGELNTAPADLGERARRMCLAHLAEMQERRESARTGLAELEPEAAALRYRIQELVGKKYALLRSREQFTNPGGLFQMGRPQTIPVVDRTADKERADQEIRETSREAAELERQELLPLENKIQMHRVALKACEVRPATIYKTSLDATGDWNRAAHQYGENVKRAAKYEFGI